ncbi:hypothetical protein [Fibrella forsythiae]|uniref:Uncharacterized protein n=1 Tax=Fibrella forsythiae TaxID=2817061 RepID=A0ABS3JU94_9BACT|nr:hypothetical protein [Fibrella forsythiae]MBO0953038.1 hypothetical protein [Fibrella forsythiae]
MPSQRQHQGGGNPQRQTSHDPDMQLVVRRLRDLYVQRQHWQAGKNMALYIAPYQGINPERTEHWIGTSDEPEAHLLAAPLNELISYYEQLLWLAGIPLPTL